jgi:hypothetical protein
MRFTVMFILLFLVSCGETITENPTTCATTQLDNGTLFRCVDKHGNVTEGIVRDGKQGAPGERGDRGPAGEGLLVTKKTQCKGEIEGWMEGTSYSVNFSMVEFQNAAKFLQSTVKLMRDGAVINERNASHFFLGTETDLKMHDGLFKMTPSGNKLEVESEGGVKASIPCEVS